MAQTTTYVNACDVVIELDDDSGSLVDISGSSNDVSISISRSLGSLVTFDGGWDIVTACKRNATVSIGAVYSTVDGEARDILEGWMLGDDSGPANRTLQISVPDSDPGSMQYTVETVIESLDLPITASSPDPIAMTAQLRTTGTFVRAVISS